MPRKSPVRRTPAVKSRPSTESITKAAAPAITPTAAVVPTTPAPVAAPAAATPAVVAKPVVAVAPAVVAAAFPADLVAGLRDGSVETAVEAAEGLAKLGDKRAVPALVETLVNADGYCHVVTRAAAAMALAKFDSKESIDALTAAARDGMAEVSREAVLALGELKVAAAAGMLVEIVANADGFYLDTTRLAAVRSLGRIKAASAKTVLAALAASTTEDAALTAAARDAIAAM